MLDGALGPQWGKTKASAGIHQETWVSIRSGASCFKGGDEWGTTVIPTSNQLQRREQDGGGGHCAPRGANLAHVTWMTFLETSWTKSCRDGNAGPRVPGTQWWTWTLCPLGKLCWAANVNKVLMNQSVSALQLQGDQRR